MSVATDRLNQVQEHEGKRAPGGTTPTAPRLRDTPVDVKLVLSSLWITLLLVFAYVDIFAFLRADVLRAALDGKTVNAAFTVSQGFLIATLIYVLVPVSMVVASLLLKARPSRVVNIAVGLTYLVTVVVSCVGETWAYYFVGSAVEVLLLAAIVATAWRWPRAVPATAQPGGATHSPPASNRRDTS